MFRVPHAYTLSIVGAVHHRVYFFFFNEPAPTEIYPLPLHDALPIFVEAQPPRRSDSSAQNRRNAQPRMGATQAGSTATRLLRRRGRAEVQYYRAHFLLLNSRVEIGRAHV